MLVDKQSELMSDLLFTVHQHGGDDVTWKPDICNKEDELDELYDKFHEAETYLATMRHKRSLMKIYLNKLKEMDDNITLADVLHVICTDIMNDNYKEYFSVIKNTKVDNIGE